MTRTRKPTNSSPDMTGDQFDRAVERATRTGVQVTGLGRFKANPHHRFAIVTSASHPGTYHVVSISDVRLSCDCEAGRRGWMCAHKAATSMYLTTRAARLRRFEEAVEEALREERDAKELAAVAAIATTNARQAATVRAATADLRQRQAQWAREARERDAAPLLRSNAPISPFRS